MLKIASMIEREVQVPEERKLVAEVIYNRLAAGNPLGIDATIRYEDQNYDEQLTESRLNTDTPYNTAHAPGPAADPDRQPRARLDRGRGEPGRRATSSTSWSSPGTCGEHVFTVERGGLPARPGRLPAGARRRGRLADRLLSVPQRLAVLGYPVSHSRSPAMQTAALAELGLGDEWSYEAIEVAPERVRGSSCARSPTTGFAGVNVTVPHKLAALALADSATDAARAIGAANTLSFERRGDRRRRTPTRSGSPARSASRSPAQRALVLGAGGSARAAIWALRNAGADVSIWNRTAPRQRPWQASSRSRPNNEQRTTSPWTSRPSTSL